MNQGITVSEKDELIMRLVHYFVTKENYSPIVVNGVKNEIWLENLEAEYKIVRINSNYIHNKEQLDFDIYKILNVSKQISRKTLTRKLKTLNILTDMNEEIKYENTKNIDTFIVKEDEDLKNRDGLLSLFPLLNESEVKDIHGLDFLLNVSNDINNKTESENKFYENIFKPKKIVITKVLIIINVLLYILTFILSLNNIDLVYYLGLNNILVRNGELYRLLTCGFMHADLIHLICNMYSLNIVGTQMENFIGKKKFIIVYLISLISGSLLSCVLNTGWSIGASGAIFGLLGSLLYFGYHYRVYLGSVLKSQIIPLIIFNLLLGFMIPSIDNFGHIGGLIGGILATMSVGLENKTQKSEKTNGIICLILLILFLSYLLFIKK
ncbi:MAG: rhomboid family intramembrane serine protease [Bacilli bacterium]|nr:rhomboid family intramembrane serine protease [Bacilli bacterium]